MTIEPLRPFQEEDLPWFLSHPRSMNLYEQRLGKTVISCNILARDPNTQNVLIVCPKNALLVWHSHLVEWFAYLAPERSVEIRLVRGKGSTAAAVRKNKWLAPRTAKVTVWIVTWGALDRDIKLLQLPSTIKSGVVFDTVIGDEVHKRLKNRKNVAVKYFQWLTRPTVCKRFHALSGTLAGKGGPADFWPILNMINPKEYSSYWRHVSTFCEVIDGIWGKEILGVKNVENFHKFVLGRYSRIRLRAICAPQMPKVQRSLLPFEVTDEQQKLLDGLAQDGYTWVPGTNGDQLVVAATSLEGILRKRQILTCPQIFSPELGVGGAMEALIERLTDDDAELTEEDKHIVIFSCFREALNPFERALRKAGFNNVWQLYGGIEPEEQQERVQKFRQTKGIILCSVKYAEAFSLTPAEICYFIGYEWDPNENKQAEDRLIPQVGTSPINSYYFTAIGHDEEVSESVNIKNRIITLTLGTAKNLRKT